MWRHSWRQAYAMATDNHISAWLQAAAAKELGVVRILHGRRQLAVCSYQEICQQAAQVAGYLLGCGLKPGDRVALIQPTQPEFYGSFFGCIWAGLIPCALYPPLRFGQLSHWQNQTAAMIKAMAAAAVICDPRFVGIVKGATAVPTLSTKDLRGRPCDPWQPVSPAAPAVIQFSSGTTGQPKPIYLSHANIMFTVNTIMACLPPADYHVGVSWLPLYHDLGLFGTVFLGLVCPGELNLIAPELFLADPRLWLEVISDRRGVISPAPNFAFGLCANKVSEPRGLDLSCWRLAICAAETVQKASIEAFTTAFAGSGFAPEAVTPGYGLAEATLAVTLAPWQEPCKWLTVDRERLLQEQVALPVTAPPPRVAGTEAAVGGRAAIRIASLGPPVPGVTVRVVADADTIATAAAAAPRTRLGLDAEAGANPVTTEPQPLPDGHVGRVLVKSPGIPQAVAEGWLDTGDRGFMYQGELFLWGRAKDTIILRGRNYDPAVIEAQAGKAKGVRPGCVVAFSLAATHGHTEALVVLVEPQGQRQPGEDLGALVAFEILESLALEATVAVVPRGSLPRTSSGKLSRSQAKTLWQEQGLKAPQRFGGWRFLAKSIRGRWQGAPDHGR